MEVCGDHSIDIPLMIFCVCGLHLGQCLSLGFSTEVRMSWSSKIGQHVLLNLQLMLAAGFLSTVYIPYIQPYITRIKVFKNE